jgi:membrane protein involved in colicin uptake
MASTTTGTEATISASAGRDVAHRLAYASDTAPLDEWAELLADDVVIDIFGEVATGKESAKAGSTARRAAGRTGPGSGSRHLVTTVVVDVTSATEAAASVTVLFTQGGSAVDSTRVVTYQDEYRRDGERWLLTRRVAR